MYYNVVTYSTDILALELGSNSWPKTFLTANALAFALGVLSVMSSTLIVVWLQDLPRKRQRAVLASRIDPIAKLCFLCFLMSLLFFMGSFSLYGVTKFAVKQVIPSVFGGAGVVFIVVGIGFILRARNRSQRKALGVSGASTSSAFAEAKALRAAPGVGDGVAPMELERVTLATGKDVINPLMQVPPVTHTATAAVAVADPPPAAAPAAPAAAAAPAAPVAPVGAGVGAGIGAGIGAGTSASASGRYARRQSRKTSTAGTDTSRDAEAMAVVGKGKHGTVTTAARPTPSLDDVLAQLSEFSSRSLFWGAFSFFAITFLFTSHRAVARPYLVATSTSFAAAAVLIVAVLFVSLIGSTLNTAAQRRSFAAALRPLRIAAFVMFWASFLVRVTDCQGGGSGWCLVAAL